MYGYNEYVPLNIEEILCRVSEEEIFQIVIQEEIVEDKGVMYTAPYREDTHPNCWFDRYGGRLWFVDFAKGGKTGMDCFEFIGKTYSISLSQTLELINDKLNLGLGDNLGKAKKIIHEHGVVEEINVKKVFKERVITYLPRPFNSKDKQFWSNYEITRDNLQKDGVIPIDIYQSTSKKGVKFSIRPIDICYAYTKFYDIDGNLLKDKVKIYRPNAPKDAKWFTNCNQNNVGCIESLSEEGEVLVITKSYKDCRVLRNMGLQCVWFQNEGQIPSKSILQYLCSRFKRIVVWFDNDSTGITSARLVKEHINNLFGYEIATTVMLPPALLSSSIKDPSDYLEKRSKTALLLFLQRNNLV